MIEDILLGHTYFGLSLLFRERVRGRERYRKRERERERERGEINRERE